MRLKLINPCPLKAGEIPDKRGHRWHCSQCDKHVVDVTQMGPERAAALLQQKAHGGRRCAQWVADRHGNVVFDVARAAAAAGVLAFAGPAMADGGDVTVDVVQLLLERQSMNKANQEQAEHATANGSEIIEDTGLMMMIGDYDPGWQPAPTPVTTPSSSTPSSSTP